LFNLSCENKTIISRMKSKGSERWIDTVEGVYKRDLVKRIELIDGVYRTLR